MDAIGRRINALTEDQGKLNAARQRVAELENALEFAARQLEATEQEAARGTLTEQQLLFNRDASTGARLLLPSDPVSGV